MKKSAKTMEMIGFGVLGDYSKLYTFHFKISLVSISYFNQLVLFCGVGNCIVLSEEKTNELVASCHWILYPG